MKNIYLVKENPKAEKESVKWVEMTRAEFGVFIKSKAAEGRFFARLPKDLGQEGDNIIYEVEQEEYATWRVEKRHIQYLRDWKKESKFEIISYNGISSSDTCHGEELLAVQTDLLDEVIHSLEFEQVRKHWNVLTKDEQLILKELFFTDCKKSERDLSAETGIPQKTINNRKRRALNKLKKYL